MSTHPEIAYPVDFGVSRQRQSTATEPASALETNRIPRVARLLALAIRLEGLVREGKVRDYAEIARRGRVTRARLSQIMKLLDLAPDIQERLLFLPEARGLNERSLRRVVREVDWSEQRRRFEALRRDTGV